MGDAPKKLKDSVHQWYLKNGVDHHPIVATGSGIPIKPLYTPLEQSETEYMDKIGLPGEYPFTRGVYPLMYRSKVWTMRQYSGYATAKESNERNKYLYQQGVTGLSVAFDLPTQMGYDSDDLEIEDEVGRVGVAIDSLADMELLFKDIPLDQISTSFTINAITPIILAMYLAVGEKQGVPRAKLTGTMQNDILKEYFSRGAFIFPPRPALRMIADTFAFCTQEMPKFVPVSVCGYHIRETGADAVQEIAYAFLNAMAYIDGALARGLKIDDFASRISFNFAAHMNLFEEVAKFRAARRIWARLLREHYEAKDPKSWKMLFFAGTGGSTYTAQQPENNIVRGTIETLAIVLGGGQALTVNTKDEGHAIPSEKATLTALRTQQIVADESGVADTADPLGGSYYIEGLTDTMEENILAAMDEIQSYGGIVKAIEEGMIQRKILKKAVESARAIEKGQKVVVGVNKYVIQEEIPEGLHAWNHEQVEEQQEYLRQMKEQRNAENVTKALQQLRLTAQSGENIMPATLEAVKNYCTVGEMCSVLREVFGEFQEPTQVF